MENIEYFSSKNLKEGDVFMSFDLYKEKTKSVYMVLEKDVDEVFNVVYLTLLTDKGQILLVNSMYLDVKRYTRKIND
jgi:hypothetical protein